MGNKSAGAIYLQKNQSAEEDDPPDQEAAVGDPELEPERCTGLDRLDAPDFGGPGARLSPGWPESDWPEATGPKRLDRKRLDRSERRPPERRSPEFASARI